MSLLTKNVLSKHQTTLLRMNKSCDYFMCHLEKEERMAFVNKGVTFHCLYLRALLLNDGVC